VSTSKNIAAEWSVAYAMSIKRLDSQFMLCLLRLMSWPNLGNMHGDLVDDLRLICALLAKRPMVGFLIARRLKLPVDKTFALLSVLEIKGHITALGANLIDLDLNALESVAVQNGKATIADSARFSTTDKQILPTPTPPQRVAKALQENADISKSVATTNAKPSTQSELSKAKVELESSGDVLNQLWRVLNTDIVMSKASRANVDPEAPVAKEAGDVLSQLWYVLNKDIGAKQETVKKTDVKSTAKSSKSKKPNTSNIGNISNTSNKINAVSKPDVEDEAVIRDVNGNIIAPEIDEASATKEDQAKDVMSQLWSVLNTDIAFKRQSGTDATSGQSAEKTKEVAEVMANLWRVLNTEIASKRQSNAKEGTESLSDTTREANDKLSKLWRILDAQIVLKKKPTTYLMTDDPLKIVKKEVEDTSGEAVDRLSQLWQVLNSEIAIALPPERRLPTAKRR
jgi:hypothetical protein